MFQLPVLCFPNPSWERRTEVCFTGTAMPKMKQQGPSISEAVWQLCCYQETLRDFNMFSKFCTSQCVAQRNRKLFSASDSGAGKTFDPHPFEIHQNSPINLTEVWVGPRDNFLKSHLAFGKVQHIRRWGICFCFEDLRCSCSKNNRDVHPCHF